MKNQIEITLGEETYQIKKMPLRKYAEFLEVIDKLPEEVKKQIGDTDLTDSTKFLASLPSLLAKAFPQLVKVLSVASDVPEEKLMNEYGLAEAATILKAIFEVNDFLAVKNALVAAFQGIKAKTLATKEPEKKPEESVTKIG